MSDLLAEIEYPPVDPRESHFSLRAILTGAVLGGVLAMANIYTGLKIGWGFNMSITAALLAYGFWSLMAALRVTRRKFTLIENNINQTGASAGASISSAGLVSAVPALTMLDKHDWSFAELAVWIFCCAGLGVFVAVLFRRQMLLRDKLTFASGIATAETLKEMYARGAEAMARVKALVGAALGAAAWKVAVALASIKALPFPWDMPLSADGAAAKAGVGAVSIGKLGFALDPSLLMVGGGMIIGIRIGAWMLIGALLSWVVIGSHVIDQGWVAVKAEADVKAVGAWLLWPGVSLLVTSSLSSLMFMAPQFIKAFRRSKDGAPAPDNGDALRDPHDVSPRWLWGGIAAMTVLTCVTGNLFFGMHWLIGLAAVGLTGILAIVALRVAGETNITPVGPMGKVTQLAFGAIDPGSVSTNLMAANVTGGSASQAGDMMHDLKAGLMLGASPKAQALSQFVGVLVASLTGAGVYLLLIESVGPKLLTQEWSAPAVAQWKAVAELFRDGFDKMPKGALDAMMWAGIIGVALTLIEKALPKRLRAWSPSASAIGIAFIVAPSVSVSFFIGGLIGWALTRWVKSWFVRFGIVVAAGFIAGESLTGMVETIIAAFAG